MARLEKTSHRGDFWKLKAGEDFNAYDARATPVRKS